MKILHGRSEEIWKEMLEECQKAEKTIYFEQYLLYPDQRGLEFLNLLSQKAKEGLDVRCIFDALGSFTLGRSKYVEEMHNAGVKILFFNWLRPFSPHNQKFLYFRNHRRLLIIDDRTAFTGGICVGEDKKGWIDTQAQVEGPVVSNMKEVFMMDWFRATRRKFRRKRIPIIEGDFMYVTSTPLPRRRYLYYQFIEAINQAKYSINLITPYFLPDHKLTRSLIKAARRGVSVRLLIPLNSNHPIVNIGSQTYFEYFLMNGIEIYRHPEMLHSKTAAIDDSWATVGSLNLDNISLRYNLEANLISKDTFFTSELNNIFWKELANSKKLALEEWRKRPFLDQVLEILVWPIRKLL
jgi:cardiolipin synthase A/B